MFWLKHIKRLWRDTADAPAFDPRGTPAGALNNKPVSNPYHGLPAHTRWAANHRGKTMGDIDPVIQAGFQINPDDRIATAGSCFAQHISRHLTSTGYTHLVTEKVHPIISPPVARDFGYGVFSARYGNIYTARQLLQLVERATGGFRPQEDIWPVEHGFVDPFRPTIQPGTV